MEKIDSTAAFFNPVAYSGLNSEPKKAQSKRSKPVFFSLLEKANEISEETRLSDLANLPVSDEVIKELLDAVHSAGDDLKNRPLPQEILQYKHAVRNFLQFVVKNSYIVEKQYIGVNVRKRKEKTLVQVVDQKLEQLAAGILAGQTAQLEILARLEEITGILIDLLE
jgi:uncharacterized protein YaaR (DUF327 family)